MMPRPARPQPAAPRGHHSASAGLPAPLPRAFYDRPAVTVAPELLNKVVVGPGGRAARLVEVEAYEGSLDPGSHAFRGRTKRNGTMWGPPGRLYVYLSYGVHWCANAVCGPEGTASAVLLRAAEPIAGLDAMRAVRWPGGPDTGGPDTGGPGRNDRDLCRGPGRLCQAMGWTGAMDGADLVTGCSEVWIGHDGTAPPSRPTVTGRVGLSAGAEFPWRWVVPDSPWASGRRRQAAD